MSLSTTVSAMAAAGCSAEQIAAVVAAHEAAQEAQEEAKRASRRAGNAERQRRHRHASNAVTGRDEALRDVTARDPSPPLKEGPHTPKENYPPTSTSSLRSDEPTRSKKPKTATEVLATALPERLARAVVEHRNRLRKPLTPFAAELLAKTLLEQPDPDGAARLMIERGWLTVKADWIANANRQNPRDGPERGNSYLQALLDFTDGLEQPHDSDHYGGPILELPAS